MGSFDYITEHALSLDLGSSTLDTLLGWLGGILGSSEA